MKWCLNSILKLHAILFLFLLHLTAQGQTQHSSIIINEDIRLIHLKDSVFIHESYFNFPNAGRYPSNGLIIIKNGKAVMVDTPNNNQQTKTLVEFLRDSLKASTELAIPCHYHSDNLGGLEYLHSLQINSVANKMTCKICEERNIVVPKIGFYKDTTINFYGLNIELAFKGGAHSVDNIVVWLPESRILFGGCMVKHIQSRNPGNITEADLDAWVPAVSKVKKSYINAEYIIPGHGLHGGPELLDHTIQLISEFNNRQGSRP